MLRGLAHIFTGRLLAAASQAVLLGAVARHAGPADFGIVAATTGAVFVIIALADLGLATLALREFAVNRDFSSTRHILRVHDRSLAGAGVLTALALVGLGLSARPVLLLLLPLGLWLVLEKSADAWSTVAVADGRAKSQARNLLLRRLGAILAYFPLSALGVDPVLAYASALTVGAVAGFGHSRWIFRSAGEIAPPTRQSPALGRARPFWINSLGVQARNLDGLVAILLVPGAGGALYSSLSRLSSPFRLLTTSFATILLPSVASREVSPRRLLISSGLVVGATGTALTGIAVAAVPALRIGLGSEYVDGARTLQVLIVGIILSSAVACGNAILQGLGSERSVASISVFTSMLALAGVAVGGFYAGALGCAAGMTTAYCLQALLLVNRVRQALQRGDFAEEVPAIARM